MLGNEKKSLIIFMDNTVFSHSSVWLRREERLSHHIIQHITIHVASVSKLQYTSVSTVENVPEEAGAEATAIMYMCALRCSSPKGGLQNTA